MQINIFPIFLIAFLILIVVLLQKPKETLENNKSVQMIKNKKNNTIHKHNFNKKHDDFLFSDKWQQEFKQHNQKETFLNQRAFINQQAQQDAWNNRISGVDHTLLDSQNLTYLGKTSPLPSTEYSKDGQSWKLQSIN
jgi:hypothetical protein